MRVPTTTRASPHAMRRHSSARSPSLMALWSMATSTPEVVAQPVDERRGQGDLRHQHQRAPTGRQRVGDGLGIDGGLAARGVTLEQHGLAPTGIDGAAHDLEAPPPARHRAPQPAGRLPRARLGATGQGPSFLDPHLELEEPPPDQPGDGRRRRVARPGGPRPRRPRCPARPAPPAAHAAAGPALAPAGRPPAASGAAASRPGPVRAAQRCCRGSRSWPARHATPGAARPRPQARAASAAASPGWTPVAARPRRRPPGHRSATTAASDRVVARVPAPARTAKSSMRSSVPGGSMARTTMPGGAR